jgi:hypothetical protein
MKAIKTSQRHRQYFSSFAFSMHASIDIFLRHIASYAANQIFFENFGHVNGVCVFQVLFPNRFFRGNNAALFPAMVIDGVQIESHNRSYNNRNKRHID